MLVSHPDFLQLLRKKFNLLTPPPLQSTVEEEQEEEEKLSATIPEKEAEKPADPPEQTNPEQDLPSTEVKRSAGLFL